MHPRKLQLEELNRGLDVETTAWSGSLVAHLSRFLTIHVLVIVSTIKIATILLPVIFHDGSHTDELVRSDVFIGQNAEPATVSTEKPSV